MLFRYLAIINLTLGTWYIIWRTTQSVNWHAWWIALPLLGAEIYGFLGGLMFIIGLWRPLVRQVRSLAHLVPALPRKEWPTVDVFIACYNEPVEMVQETARAALAMDYPAEKLRVYVLDDGNTPAMRTMAEQLCLKDLQTPALQTYSKTLQMKRQQLVEQKMALEAARLELEQTDDRADLPLLKKITRLLSPQQIPLDEQICSS
ncbi:MAG: cellulose synthase, partial [Cyanobacteria bacterium J06555_13]